MQRSLHFVLAVLLIAIFMPGNVFGVTVRYVQLIERNSNDSWNMVELEAFEFGVIPNELGGGSGDGLTTSTNDIGDGVIGTLASQTTSTLQHGGANEDPNNVLDAGAGAWTTSGHGGFGDPQYTLDLGGDFDVRLLRTWPRQGCCGGRWGGDIEVNLFADGGGGTLGALIATTTVTPTGISDALELSFAADPTAPEPSTLVLAGLGLAGLGLIGRRRRNRTLNDSTTFSTGGRIGSRSLIITAVALAIGLFATTDKIQASTILGTGNGALLGNDLTDPDQNGTAGGANYDAIFTSTNEPGFGGGEFSFNVFSNTLGGGSNKWCCDGTGGSGHQLTAQILPTGGNPAAPLGYVLTHFTVSSSNDSPTRDPRVWSIEGSNDGTNFTTIFSQNNPAAALWTARDQVIRFDAGVDYALPTGYEYFRYNVTTTGGVNHALGEIEYFGVAAVASPAPEPSTFVLAAFGLLGLGLRRRRTDRK